MKILKVLHGFPPETSGGTERVVEALARAMQAAGHRVVIAAGSLALGDPAEVGREDFAGLDVRRLHRDDLYFEHWFKSHSPAVSAAFAALLARERPDVVHVHHWLRLTSDLVRLARDAGCVTAVTAHDYFSALATPVRRAGDDRPAPPAAPGYVSAAEVDEAFAFHRRDFQAELSAAHLRFAPSQSHARGLQQMAAGPLGPFAVASPPLLRTPARMAARPTRRHRLMAWGSWYEAKGLETVIEALRRSGGAWQLDVYGDATDAAYQHHLAELARGLPVQFHGAFEIGDLAAADADFAVLPSLCHESYGLTMDEALFLGLPVLAADLPVYRERAPASSVAFFAAGDAAALAEVLCDRERLRGLETPVAPAVVTAQDAAVQALAAYERAADRDAPAPADTVTGEDRALQLFRRAERRLWTALQQEDPPAPPDDFPS